MKKKILSFLSMVLILSFVFSTTALADTKQRVIQDKAQQLRQDTQKRLHDIRDINNSLSAELQKLRKEAADIVRKITNHLKGVSDEQYANDPVYLSIKTALNNAKTALQESEKNNSVAEDIKAYRELLKTDEAAAAAKLEEIKAALEAKQSAFTQLITDLKAALSSSESFTADKKEKINEWLDFRQDVMDKRVIISENHTAIVKAERDSRNIINQIVATIAANKDLLADKQDELALVVSNMKEIKNSLKLKDGSIRVLSAEYNALRLKKDYAGALAKLDEIAAVQTARIAALNSLKTQLNDQLIAIEAIIASPAVTTAA
ncbi:MAG: hypothetical protein BGN88_01300 [Clostridiales bacterium 43-6]|nr:MAG: hypothetical protein BGN88_01300 [Clostridiales bacterium 43-6]